MGFPFCLFSLGAIISCSFSLSDDGTIVTPIFNTDNKRDKHKKGSLHFA